MKQSNHYHILNGDALKEQFPASIPGKLIIARECLVDGNVQGETLEVFFKNRAEFLTNSYDIGSDLEYFKKTVPEFNKILNIPEYSVINLWFEDDLFCQVNLWFVANLLSRNNITFDVTMVRPLTGYEYGFGGMNTEQLTTAFKEKSFISPDQLEVLSKMWTLYQNEKTEEMVALAQSEISSLPFLLPAVLAYKESLPNQEFPGRPKQTLLNIMDELETDHFGEIFREFCKKEAIYGFGDLQVKRMVDEILMKP